MNLRSAIKRSFEDKSRAKFGKITIRAIFYLSPNKQGPNISEKCNMFEAFKIYCVIS